MTRPGTLHNWLNISSNSPPAYKFAVQPGEVGYGANANIELWTISDAGYNPNNLYRNSLARYFLPSGDEWYTVNTRKFSMQRTSMSSRGGFNTEHYLSPLWIGVLVSLSLFGMSISGYLEWGALTSSKIAGCGGGRLFNCGHVLNRRWSLWMGVPVSLLAVSCYFGIFAGLIVGSGKRFNRTVRNAGWIVVSMLAMAAPLQGSDRPG